MSEVPHQPPEEPEEEEKYDREAEEAASPVEPIERSFTDDELRQNAAPQQYGRAAGPAHPASELGNQIPQGHDGSKYDNPGSRHRGFPPQDGAAEEAEE